ncbi:MAG: carboxypeptidase regulatory-like domain-containing protein [bacterium]|nr:MAG: carboxypeptidase regulatory-like domain-containing protein [bacterium]
MSIRRSTGKALAAAAAILALIFLFLQPDRSDAAQDKEKKSGIRGRIVMKSTGEPVAKAYVYAYVGKIETRAAQLGIIGITDWVSRGSAEDGTYKLDLPPGEYFIGARKRANGLNYGPLYRGDYYDHQHARKAFVVRKGKYGELDFKLIKLEEPMFFQGLTAVEKVTDTGIRGKLLDENGEHIPGTFVMAYSNDDMQRAPDFASTLTDDEGNYTLYLPKGGRYWLAGRFYAMKMPQKDEPFARYEGSQDHSVVVEQGKFLEGIDLVLRPYDGDTSGSKMPMH